MRNSPSDPATKLENDKKFAELKATIEQNEAWIANLIAATERKKLEDLIAQIQKEEDEERKKKAIQELNESWGSETASITDQKTETTEKEPEKSEEEKIATIKEELKNTIKEFQNEAKEKAHKAINQKVEDGLISPGVGEALNGIVEEIHNYDNLTEDATEIGKPSTDEEHEKIIMGLKERSPENMHADLEKAFADVKNANPEEARVAELYAAQVMRFSFAAQEAINSAKKAEEVAAENAASAQANQTAAQQTLLEATTRAEQMAAEVNLRQAELQTQLATQQAQQMALETKATEFNALNDAAQSAQTALQTTPLAPGTAEHQQLIEQEKLAQAALTNAEDMARIAKEAQAAVVASKEMTASLEAAIKPQFDDMQQDMRALAEKIAKAEKEAQLEIDKVSQTKASSRQAPVTSVVATPPVVEPTTPEPADDFDSDFGLRKPFEEPPEPTPAPKEGIVLQEPLQAVEQPTTEPEAALTQRFTLAEADGIATDSTGKLSAPSPLDAPEDESNTKLE
ncbi:MAG: hypothetical protein NTU49_02550 [Gammaproteobacteria bacterium]|nr:hypothetical protein [Gammaproteobacteria bacterium]